MSQCGRKDCCGTLFPSTLDADADRPMRGQVFAYQILKAGGTFCRGREVSADLQAWHACQSCELFESCYKLSLGKLVLEAAIREI